MDVVELQARKLRLVSVALGVETRSQKVDDLDPSLLSGTVLEQFLLAGPNGTVPHRLLDHLQPGSDLLAVGGRAVPPEHELAHVGRYRILPAKLLGQILLDQIAVESGRRKCV